MQKFGLSFLCLAVCLLCSHARAQNGAAPELFGIGEVMIEYAHFDNPHASDECGLTREGIEDSLVKTLRNTGVPAVESADAKPVMQGVARIQLIPVISSYIDENHDCVSWISLSAESHVSVVIPPVATLRSVTEVYWRQHTEMASGQSSHKEKTEEIMQKLVTQFAQQYRLDQPPELPK